MTGDTPGNHCVHSVSRLHISGTHGSPAVSMRPPAMVLSDHPQFADRLSHNLRHKADLLGLPSDVDVEVVSAGPPRKFLVQRAPRHGSTAAVRIKGDVMK